LLRLLLNLRKQALPGFHVTRTVQVVVNPVVITPNQVQVDKFNVRQLPIFPRRERFEFFAMARAVKHDNSLGFYRIMAFDGVNERLVVR
jgi:hypothetical protein